MGTVHSQETCDRLRRLCQVHTKSDAAEIVGVSRHFVTDLAARGWKAGAHANLRPRPTDFAVQCQTMTMIELCQHYRAGLIAVRRWAREIGRKPLPPRKKTPGLPIPEDLAERVAELGPYGTALHYGVSYGTVKRWRRARGLPVSWSRQPKRARPKPASQQVGWADRYHQENSHVGR